MSRNNSKFILFSLLTGVLWNCGAELPHQKNSAEVLAEISCATNRNYNCITHESISNAIYKVNLTASGMTGNIVVNLNASEQLTITSSGSYSFSTSLASGTPYSVAITTKPDSHTCSFTNASGQVLTSDINVTLFCRPFKFIYLTTPTYTGGLGGITGADSICNSHANRPDIKSTYKALLGSVNGSQRWGCTSAPAQCSDGIDNSQNWVLYANTTYKRASDSVVIGTTTIDRVFNFSLSASLGISGLYWSGLENTAPQFGYSTAGTSECNGWSDGTIGPFGNRGDLASVSSTSANTSNLNCNNTYSILCAEQ
ncbi:MAG: DUF1554 domain-containing protein [Leptospiraceae bacterium]|nr:DUF1554 domain-containing protein [Leptospiraceae bacterium]MCK6382275.1 DUF1554 domain-containing protein [Leptospiraceae bacterium]NUM41717.1 DUF1554 domain-containing protein [Leptospiraceae bacterium]